MRSSQTSNMSFSKIVRGQLAERRRSSIVQMTSFPQHRLTRTLSISGMANFDTYTLGVA